MRSEECLEPRVPTRKTYTPVSLEEIIQSEQFERFYTMRFDINYKLSVNPYDKITKIEQVTVLSAKVVTLNRSSFLIESTSKEQARMLTQVDKVGEYQYETTKYDKFIVRKN